MPEEDLEYLNLNGTSFSFKLVKEGNGYTVQGLKGAKIEGSFKSLPATVETPYGTLTFTENLNLIELNKRAKKAMSIGDAANVESKNTSWIITIRSPKSMASAYAGAVSIAPTSKQTSIALLTIRDQDAERGLDYLKQLAVCYNRQANADKN
jgi:hypothetical protein